MHIFQFEIVFTIDEDGSEVRQTGVTGGKDYADAVMSLKTSFNIADKDISSIVLSDMKSGVLIARPQEATPVTEQAAESNEPSETEE